MFLSKNHDRTIIEISQGDFVAITAESFLIDRQAGELSKKSIKFYKQFLKFFIEHCDANSLKQIRQVNPDFLPRYFLSFAETHNPGGVHAAYRTLRAFFRWITEEEIMTADWKNPMQKVKAPKVNIDPLEPIALEDVKKLIDTCQQGSFMGERDKSIFLFLLDTGARAQETCNIDINDIDLNTGGIVIRYGKGGGLFADNDPGRLTTNVTGPLWDPTRPTGGQLRLPSMDCHCRFDIAASYAPRTRRPPRAAEWIGRSGSVENHT